MHTIGGVEWRWLLHENETFRNASASACAQDSERNQQHFLLCPPLVSAEAMYPFHEALQLLNYRDRCFRGFTRCR